MGHTHQFLSPYLKPVQNESVILGRAMPVLEADVFDEKATGNNPLMAKPFGLMFEALDDLKKNEVLTALQNGMTTVDAFEKFGIM